MIQNTEILISQIIEAYKEPSIVVCDGNIKLSNTGFDKFIKKNDISSEEIIKHESNILIKDNKSFKIKRSLLKIESVEYELLILDEFEELQEKLSRFEKIFSNLPSEVFAFKLLDNNNFVLSFKQGNISKQFEKSSRYGLNSNLEDILSGFGLSKNLINDYKSVLKGKSVSHTIDIAGKVFRIALSPLEYDDQGNVVEIVGFADDISDKALLTKYYEESENRFRLLFEKEKLSKLIINAETLEIIDANTSAIRTLGYGSNLIGMKLYEINSMLKNKIPYLIDQVFKGEEESIIESFETQSGKKISFEFFLTGMEIKNKKVIKATLIDISDKLEAEKQLKNYINEIEEKNIFIQNRNEEIQAINEELRVTTEDLEYTLRRLNDKNNNINAVLNASFDSIIVLNSHFRIIEANQKAENYFSVKKDVLIGKDIIKLISDENKNEIKKLKRQVDEYEIGEIIIINNLYNNNITHVEVRASKFKYEDNEHYIIMLRDISKLMEANRKITETNNKLNFLIKYNPNIIYTINIQNNQVTYISENTFPQLGYNNKDLIGNIEKIIDRIYPDDINIFKSSINNIIDEGHYENEFRLIKNNGDIVWIHNKMVLTTNDDGSKRNIIGTFIDITEKKKAEYELNILNQRFEFILKHSPAIIYTLDPQNSYRTTFTSKNVEEKLGFSEKDFIENTELWRDRIHKDDYEKALHALEIVKDKGYYSHEYRIIDANNNQKWLHDELRVLYDENNESLEIIGSVLDVTQLKESEQELIELNATKDKFFSIIAHDLKSPLSGILNLTGLLVREFDKLSIDQMLDISKKLYNTSINFNKLLENLLLWSRISRESIDYDPQKFRLIDFPTEALQLLDNSIKEKLIKINIDISDNVFVYVDMNMLDTVFRNIISNAIKFTPKNGKITVTAEEGNKNFVEVKVIDNGIGIKPENIQKIFRIEEKLSTRGTEGESGTGLGLIICKEFIQKHSGDINIESEPEKGTMVIFNLPIKK